MSEGPKVVSLRGDEIIQPGEVNAAVVAEAERILELARSGEIVGISSAFVHRDECTSSHYVGLNGRRLLGQLDLMHAEIVRGILERDGRL